MESCKKKNLWVFVWTLACAAFWIALVCALACCSADSGGEEPAPLRVTFLDVGQGLAVLLECDGRYALYDTGPDSAGLVDTLAARGVDSLSWVLVSHGHRDHAGGFWEMGAAFAASRLWVGRLLVGPDTAAGVVPDSILRIARQFKISVDTLVRGDTVWLADGVVLESLWPVGYGRFGENRASVVLKVAVTGEGRTPFSVGDAVEGNGISERPSLLLTGDLDSVGENRLLELSPSLSADLLQVAHHGSAGSNTLRFLSQVSPQYAAIGVGKNNCYGHPKADVLQKLYYVIGDSAAVFRTDLHGSFSFEMRPGIGVVLP